MVESIDHVFHPISTDTGKGHLELGLDGWQKFHARGSEPFHHGVTEHQHLWDDTIIRLLFRLLFHRCCCGLFQVGHVLLVGFGGSLLILGQAKFSVGWWLRLLQLDRSRRRSSSVSVVVIGGWSSFVPMMIHSPCWSRETMDADEACIGAPGARTWYDNFCSKTTLMSDKRGWKFANNAGEDNHTSINGF
jgi:hypothetical protein